MKPPKLKDSDVTDYKDYINRKSFLKKSAITAVSLLSPAAYYMWSLNRDKSEAKSPRAPQKRNELKIITSKNYAGREDKTAYEHVTGYNNFYEFSTDKEDVAKKAENFITEPWKIQVDGEVEKAGNYGIEDLVDFSALEERIYRLRCVEGWSMVIPWTGFPLKNVINKVKPTGKAMYVKFTTLYDPRRMPGQNRSVLDWPYVEGLRMDEAMHPLTILSVGLYGKVLPNQNGAPVRLVVPWKYGFKSIKSIVRITFTRDQPVSTWTAANPAEYGFYSNVNPNVDHPRWSQKMERRIGSYRKRETLMFNGYADEVGHLYKNMDLMKYY